MLLDDQGLQERVARMETLLGEIETFEDPNARAKAAEMVQVLLELYGEGLARVMEVVAEGEERERIFEPSPGTSWSRTCCSCTGCTRWTWRRGWSGPSMRCVPYLRIPRWERAVAGHRGTAWRGCGWREAATDVRPPP